jgi:hypothetical protein
MDEQTIEPWPCVRTALFPSINYLHRLRERMEKAGFPPDDKLFALVSKAYDAVHALFVELHYLGCESGVGREPRRAKEVAKTP